MSTQTILVVDDEFAIRRLLARLLRRPGVRVLTADTVPTAETLLLYNQVDLILCDYQMPGEKGISFLTRLKGQYPDMVRTLITGHADFALTMEAINDAEVHYCITKPFEATEIKELVTDLLTWSDRQDAGPQRAFTQQQRADIHKLSEHHPGIGEVRRDTGGAIVVEQDLDLDADWPGDDPDESDDGSDDDVIVFSDHFSQMIGA